MINSIKDFFDYIESTYGNKTAYQFISKDSDEITRITFSKYASDVRNFAERLKDEFDNISEIHFGILASTSYECIVVIMGILVAGGKVVILNGQEQRNTLEREIRIADVSVIYTDGAYQKREPGTLENLKVKIESIDSVYEKSSGLHPVVDCNIDKDEMVVLLFTSGTTSENKAVMLSTDNILSMVGYNFRLIRDTRQDLKLAKMSCYLIVPLYHVSGLNLLFSFNNAGESIDLCSSVRNVYKDLVSFGSVYTTVPPIILNDFYKELSKGNVKKLGGLRVLICGGAAFDHDFLDVFEQNGIVVRTAYGMTETTGIGCISHSHETDSRRRLKSVGTFDEECLVTLKDGEICFRGRTVTKGYYNNPEATDEAIDSEGWFHSGDLGCMDEDGYVFITGRKKNLIILASGENVSPEELESLLLEDQNIIECIVREKDNKICAEIYCDEEKDEQIRLFVRDINRKLTPYKRIGAVEFRRVPFERTSLGKIKRN